MSEKPASTALPAHFYRDPMESAMRNQERQCTGCRHLTELLSRKFCGKGRRELRKCKKYDQKTR